MQFVIPKAELLKLMGHALSIIPARSALPILSNILIEAANDELVLTVTDLTVSMRCFANANIQREGATTLPARKFFQLIRELPDMDVEIVTNENDITRVVAGASRFKLNGMSRDDFPHLPSFAEATRFELPQSVLHELLFRTSFAVSREENRYILTGALCKIENGKATFIGTDGKRMAMIQKPIRLEEGFEGRWVLPLKAVEELIKALKEEETSVTLLLEKDKIAFELNHLVLMTKLLAGDYPKVEQVIPKTSNVKIALHREEMISLLKQVSLFAEDTDQSVRFIFDDGELAIEANQRDVGEGNVKMPVNYSAEKLEIAFNPYYFLDILRHSDDDIIHLSLTDGYSPGVITDSSDGVYLLMPMKLN